jgi:hypothetical protein
MPATLLLSALGYCGFWSEVFVLSWREGFIAGG